MSFWRGKASYRWIILLTCMLVYCTSQLVRWNYASITKYLMTDLNIGKPELGLLGSAFFYSYAVAQIPWGVATDMFGGRRVIPIGIAILAFFLMGFALSATFTQAIIWRALMGVVAAAGYVPITSVLAKWFGLKERGFAMEMYSGVGGGLGEALTFLLIPILAVVMAQGGIFGLDGWRGSTAAMGIVILIIAISSALMLKSSPTDIDLPSIQAEEDKTKSDDSEDYKAGVRKIAKDPALWIMSIVWSCYMVATRLVPGWLPLYATDFYIQQEGMSKESAIIAGGFMATLYVLGRVFGTPVVGKISDRLLKRNIPRSVVIGIGLLMIAALFFLFTLRIPTPFLLMVLSFVSGVAINIFPLISASAAEIWSVRSAGFTMGIINTVGQFAGAMALSVSGFMAVKFSVSGGSYETEFLGIWYLGIATSIFGALASVYVVMREKGRRKTGLELGDQPV
ncbi:Sugar phosphate permease [Cupriavidus sp. YR651]|uniref:MFS transporter n=1 Tax=Cupriavidus sp. YR651 TaxID=1855315 RepID=UPI0008822A5B|nr:MFS transporter [Cupriavidus sp. YR651]SDB97850.1 Sugar phosphate permease [Cupriavidus sp. YR651]